MSFSLLHRKYLPTSISHLDLPEGDCTVYSVYLSGDRLYLEVDKTLHVYCLSDLSTPIATYPLGKGCLSGIITENRIYLGGDKKLHIFEVTTSLS